MDKELKEAKKVIVPASAWKRSRMRRAFFKGLTGVLPVLLTIVVLVWCYNILRDYMGVHMNAVIQWIVGVLGLEKAVMELNKGVADFFTPYVAFADPTKDYLVLRPIVGIILSLILIYFVGSFISSFVGRKLFPRVEKMLLRVPVVKAVYPYARQVTDFFLGEKTIPYERIVAVEYPRKGIWTVAFVTNEGLGELCEKTGKRLVTIFIGSSPAPITGYVIMVPADEVIPLNITIDEALRLLITGGVSLPGGRAVLPSDERVISQGKLPPPLPDGNKQD